MDTSPPSESERHLRSGQTDMLDKLTAELHRLNQHRFVNVHNSLWRLVMFQFLRGLAFGLGSVIGATILFSVFAWWVSQMEFLPIVGEWMSEILQQIEQTRSK